MVITWVLGFGFLFFKGIEWTADYREGIVPAVRWTYGHEGADPEFEEHQAEMQRMSQEFGQQVTPDQVMMYFVVYFCMTGLHGIHMVIGLGLVGWFIWLDKRRRRLQTGGYQVGQFSGGNDQPV